VKLLIVRTVNGDIPVEKLGVCQTHEHVFCDQRLGKSLSLMDKTAVREPTMGEDFRYYVLNDEEVAFEELSLYKNKGGCAIVDATTSGWGRDLERLARISSRTGVHIIATAGFYVEPNLPEKIGILSIDQLASALIKEINVGVGPNRIRPGILKSAIWRARIEGYELKALRAVARAQLATGVAITTHSTGARRYEIPCGNIGRYHLDVLLEEGVAPNRLIIGHTDGGANIDFLIWAGKQGAFVQFDLIGKQHMLLDETRVDWLERLLDEGLEDQILLTTDRCRKQELYRELGGAGYTYLFDRFIPMCESRGIQVSTIQHILTSNPARALAIDVN